jgi:predicted phosphodiesterase
MNGMRILLAGDWHGNLDFAADVFDLAAEEGCATVLQLGDFGLWPGREDAWLDHVGAQAARTGVDLVWVDGNHENHDSLDAWRRGAPPDGLVPMRPRVRWASRGARWEWAGVRFGALGGAVSADRFLRRAGHNWWPQEMASQADVDRLGDAPLDVLASHAAPTSYPAPRKAMRLPADILADAATHRDLLDQAVRRTRPRQVLHGHYHLRLHADLDGWSIDGLGHDKGPLLQACAVMELEAGDFRIRKPEAPGRPRRESGPEAWPERIARSGGSAPE